MTDNGAAAQAAKKEAIERVGRNANPEWKAAALNSVYVLARIMPELTTDPVHKRLERLNVDTHEKRALGNVMTTAAKNGWIEKAGRQEETERAVANSRPLTVWKSLIYGT